MAKLPLTTSEVAKEFSAHDSMIRRVVDAEFPDLERFGGRRAIPRELLPAIADALRARGWLPLDAQEKESVGASS